MRIPFFRPINLTPFDGLKDHAEKVKECVWAFQQAIDCYTSGKKEKFEEYRKEVIKLESEADAIKNGIRGHIPLGTRLPASKFQMFSYLSEQDKVCDSVENSLDWISYKLEPGLPDELKENLNMLMEIVIDTIENLSRMVVEGKKYFESYSDAQRNIVKDIIHYLRQREHDADRVEADLKCQIFKIMDDAVGILHAIRLVEEISSIADHAENAGDMMRAMIARKKRVNF